MFARLLPQLPLLRRELTELANRRRTYVIRLVGAIALLTIVLLVLRSSLSRTTAGAAVFGAGPRGIPMTITGPARYFGVGGAVFQDIVPWLFRSIQLLMPALCCGTLTMEKERNTLGTLFLTRLSPLSIVLEKLASRLVPMLTFLLLTFPVLAYVYSLGGVDTNLLLSTLWLLLCECLLYASIAMLCSSWFRTTVSAFVCSYIVVTLLLLSSAVLRMLTLTPYDIWLSRFQDNALGPQSRLHQLILYVTSLAGIDVTLLTGVLVLSVPALLLAGVCLLLARFFLFRRAFVTSSSPMLRLFRHIDHFFVRLNEKTTRGIELIKDTNAMPLFDPIAWRERSRKSLGKARYLFRVLTVLEVPTLFICGLAAVSSASTNFAGLRVLLSMLWILAALVLTVKASTAISSERARETIEPLLSTPMTAAQILQEKIVGMRRLMIVLAVPILSIHFTLLLLHLDVNQLLQPGGLSAWGLLLAYALLTVVATFNAMLLLSWAAAGLGMRCHSQTRSVLAAATLNAAWLLLPLLLARVVWGVTAYQPYNNSVGGNEPRSMAAVLPLAVTPAGPVVMSEVYLNSASGDRFYRNQLLPRVADSTAVTLLLAVLVQALQFAQLAIGRQTVLQYAPLLLNRRENLAGSPPAAIQAPLSSSVACDGAIT